MLHKDDVIGLSKFGNEIATYDNFFYCFAFFILSVSVSADKGTTILFFIGFGMWCSSVVPCSCPPDERTDVKEKYK